MKTSVVCEVIKVESGVGRASGKAYNKLTVGLPGFEKASFFIDEKMVPDFFEGMKVEIEFEIYFKNWLPQFKIKSYKAV